MTGFGGGAIFYNELITVLINPNNERPDVQGVRTTYFNQPSILRNVPQVFLVLGVLTVILQTLGILLLRMPGPDDEVDDISMQEVTPIVNQANGDQKHQHQQQQSKAQQQQDQPQDKQQQRQQQQQPVQYHGQQPQQQKMCEGEQQNGRDRSTVLEINGSNGHTQNVEGDAASMVSGKEDVSCDKSPREMLRSPDFYILWIALAFNHYGYIIKNNYYKEFGQTTIDNDHFLTTTGTIATVAVSLARVVWGLATDWMGCKIVLNLVSPPIIRSILLSFGWFWVFFSIAIVNLFGTIALLFLKEPK
ncbi:hypothetical protein EGW08_004691 [Elysia chlorotica]|uniref:Uncharacterized protein n=1 Tax=Elysia chlorotica TaxID=188477 RepID=A0A3S1BN58_ELYCH|nr:hypothetical protein EGW08_004691 [Elysia chlorotica]